MNQQFLSNQRMLNESVEFLLNQTYADKSKKARK